MRKIIQLVMFMYLLLFPAIGLAGEFILYGIKFGMSKEEIESISPLFSLEKQYVVGCEKCWSFKERDGFKKPGRPVDYHLDFDNEGKLFYIDGIYSYWRNDAQGKEVGLLAITEKSKEFVNGDKNVETKIIEVDKEGSGFLELHLQFVHVPLRNKYMDFLKDEMLNKMK